MDKIKQALLTELVVLQKESARINKRVGRIIKMLNTNVDQVEKTEFEKYLQVISELIDSGIIDGMYYGWDSNGQTLRIWASGIWDQYEKSIINNEEKVNPEIIKSTFLRLSDISREGSLPVVNFKNEDGGYTRQRGYRIKNADQNKLLVQTFKQWRN